MAAFLVTIGSGGYGDEWMVLGVFTTRAEAEAYKAAYESPRRRLDGSDYTFDCDIEEWPFNPTYVPDDDQNRRTTWPA